MKVVTFRDVIDRRILLVYLFEVKGLIAGPNAGVEVLILKLECQADRLRVEAYRLSEIRRAQLRSHS
jgi:hypothetical protein